jgi:hypothetical protein
MAGRRGSTVVCGAGVAQGRIGMKRVYLAGLAVSFALARRRPSPAALNPRIDHVLN